MTTFLLLLSCALAFLCFPSTSLPTISGPSKGSASVGDLHSECILCVHGKQQSPVDINETRVLPGSETPLVTRYDQALGTLELDHGLLVRIVAGGGYALWRIRGPTYRVVNVHWHTPSEHTINGVRFPLEGHIVHMRGTSQILVIGILYDIGAADRLISSIIQWPTQRGIVELDNVKSDFYNYEGSLTTPPCTEGLEWVVLQERYTVSQQQLAIISNINKGDNARPVQLLNGRSIFKFNHSSSGLSEM